MNLRKHYATLLALGVVCGLLADTSARVVAGDACCKHGNLCHECDLPICYPSGPPFGYNPTSWNRWPIQVIEEHVVSPVEVVPQEPVIAAPPIPVPVPAAVDSAAPDAPHAIESPSNEAPPQDEPSEPATPPVPGVREEPQGSSFRPSSLMSARRMNRDAAKREALAAREALLNELNVEHEASVPVLEEQPLTDTDETPNVATPRNRARTACAAPVVVPVAEGATQKTAQHKTVRQRFYIFAKTRRAQQSSDKSLTKISGLSVLVTKLSGVIKKSQSHDERIELLGRTGHSQSLADGEVKQTAGGDEIGFLVKPISMSKVSR